MINGRGNWKPLALDGVLFNNTLDFEGLVGIEECTDFNLVRPAKRTLECDKSSTKRKKKKASHPKNVNEEITPSKNGSTCDDTLSEVFSCNDLNNHTEIIKNMEAWDNFNLPPVLLYGLSSLGFRTPTEIQSLTIFPAIKNRKDILGAAETGSGKTLAFGIPLIDSILKLKAKSGELESNTLDSEIDLEHDPNHKWNEPANDKPLYSLILTPTRELAIQVKNHIDALAKHAGITVAVVVGGMAAVKQERILSKGPEIVVATPGRLWQLIQLNYPHINQIQSIRHLVIDETDRMLEKGHFEELHQLLELINADDEKRKQRQNFVFSATLTLIHDLPSRTVNKLKMKRSKRAPAMNAEQKLKKIIQMLGISDPEIIDVTKGVGLSQTITESRINCDILEKDYYVYYFLQKHPGRTLIFCNSIGCVKRLTTLLNLLDCKVFPLHASIQQRQRLKNLERFQTVENSILVATDVASRGLDIPGIEHVIHYQTPRTSENYVHRSGRTARAINQGLTVLLVESNELRNYLKLCKTLGKTEDIPLFPVEDNHLSAIKERVHLARELDNLQLRVRKTNSELGWFEKAAKEMDIIIDHMPKKEEFQETAKWKKVADIKRKQLADLLSKPIFPRGFSGKYFLSSNLQQEEPSKNAIDLVKSKIEQNKTQKKKLKPLYKPKQVNGNYKIHKKGR